jgi:hypothetical protein
MHKYEVIVTTSPMAGAGTDCGVFMQIYGNKKVGLSLDSRL